MEGSSEAVEVVSWAENLIETFAVQMAYSTVLGPYLSEIEGGSVHARMNLQALGIVVEPEREHLVHDSQFASGRLCVHLQSRSHHLSSQARVPKRNDLTRLVAWEVAESGAAISEEEVTDCSHPLARSRHHRCYLRQAGHSRLARCPRGIRDHRRKVPRNCAEGLLCEKTDSENVKRPKELVQLLSLEAENR